MRRPLLPLTLALGCLSAGLAGARERATFRYTPPQGEDRPVITEAMMGPQGNDFALRLTFTQAPFGEECGSRCASATLLLDTDSNVSTGLKLTGKAPENGADLALIIQGARDLSGATADSFLRVKVRRLTNEAHTVDQGELIAELDHRKDPDRVYTEGSTIYLLIDASGDLPSGRKVRVVYHPPGEKAIQASISGMVGGGAQSKVTIFRKGGRSKPAEGAKRVNAEPK